MFLRFLADTKNMAVRVLLVDDDAGIREVMRVLLSLHDDLEVVDEAVDGLDAIERAEELRPDLLVLDLTMPRVSGTAALPTLVADNPAMRIVAVTAMPDVDPSVVRLCDAVIPKTRMGELLGKTLTALAASDMSPAAVTRRRQG